METLLVHRADNGVVTLTLNRPERKNAINGTMFNELLAVFREVNDSTSDRVLVITGAGDGFCSGADLAPGDNPDLAAQDGGIGSTFRQMRVVGRAALRLHQLPQPSIAAVNGVAAGAGLNLALGCDLIVASDAAQFSEIFVRRGLSIDFGGSWLLPRLVGLHKAKELAFLAETIDAAAAERYGIVNRVVPAADLEREVEDLARRVAAQPPVQISITKKLLNQSLSVSMGEALEFEDVAQSLAVHSADTREAMLAFIERREPKFTGQ
jgi:2-(1,2-epoxy-1,2-dihydrophenyl)acetyl-CoA isomerase